MTRSTISCVKLETCHPGQLWVDDSIIHIYVHTRAGQNLWESKLANQKQKVVYFSILGLFYILLFDFNFICGTHMSVSRIFFILTHSHGIKNYLAWPQVLINHFSWSYLKQCLLSLFSLFARNKIVHIASHNLYQENTQTQSPTYADPCGKYTKPKHTLQLLKKYTKPKHSLQLLKKYTQPKHYLCSTYSRGTQTQTLFVVHTQDVHTIKTVTVHCSTSTQEIHKAKTQSLFLCLKVCY